MTVFTTCRSIYFIPPGIQWCAILATIYFIARMGFWLNFIWRKWYKHKHSQTIDASPLVCVHVTKERSSLLHGSFKKTFRKMSNEVRCVMLEFLNSKYTRPWWHQKEKGLITNMNQHFRVSKTNFRTTRSNNRTHRDSCDLASRRCCSHRHHRWRCCIPRTTSKWHSFVLLFTRRRRHRSAANGK